MLTILEGIGLYIVSVINLIVVLIAPPLAVVFCSMYMAVSMYIHGATWEEISNRVSDFIHNVVKVWSMVIQYYWGIVSLNIEKINKFHPFMEKLVLDYKNRKNR